MASYGFHFRGVDKNELKEMRKRLNTLAEMLGYVPKRGNRAGQGSASMLIAALANADAERVAEVLKPVLGDQ